MSKPAQLRRGRKELERIVAQLESGQADLENALALWERGEELYRLCLARLDAAQGKVEELAGRARAARPERSRVLAPRVWRRELLRSTRPRAARCGG